VAHNLSPIRRYRPTSGTILLAEELPELDLGDHVFSRNIGAYSRASSTWFNGFPPAKVVHLNR